MHVLCKYLIIFVMMEVFPLARLLFLHEGKIVWEGMTNEFMTSTNPIVRQVPMVILILFSLIFSKLNLRSMISDCVSFLAYPNLYGIKNFVVVIFSKSLSHFILFAVCFRQLGWPNKVCMIELSKI
jgi:hypothetical protein